MEPFFKWNIRWESKINMDWLTWRRGFCFRTPTWMGGLGQSLLSLHCDSSWDNSMANVGIDGIAQSHSVSHGIWIAFPYDCWNSGWFSPRYFYFSVLAKFFIMVFFFFFLPLNIYVKILKIMSVCYFTVVRIIVIGTTYQPGQHILSSWLIWEPQ